jgi:hypothetical protein
MASIIANARNPNSGNCEAIDWMLIPVRNLLGIRMVISSIAAAMMINKVLFFGSLNWKDLILVNS